MYKSDHNNTKSSGLIPEGMYECIIRDVVDSVSKSGTEHLTARLIIRNDVEQGYQNKYIFYDIWKTRATGDYNMQKFNELGKAARLENGKTYASYKDFFDELKLKPVAVTVHHETFNNYTSVKVSNIDETAYLDVKHDMSKIKDKVTGIPSQLPKPEIIDEDDEELPF